MFADHWDQFVLVSERNTPGVWLRSSRLFGATSILRTGLASPLWPSSQLATGLAPLAPRSGLERSDFVQWHISRVCLDGRLGQKSGGLPTFVDP